MKTNTRAPGLSTLAVYSLLLWTFAAGPANAAQITESEAVTIAEWWYANEISSPNTVLPTAEKATRLANRTLHQVHSVLGRDKLQTKRQANDAPMAYVVTFEPSGFVLVSGEDRLNPVLAFNTTGAFQWNAPEKS